MKSSNSLLLRKLVTLAMYTAILLALGMPNSPLHFLGFPQYGPFNATTLHMIVIAVAILEGPASGTFMGLVWGLVSMFTAFTGASVTAPAFMNPLISVVPRMLVGLFSGLLFQGLRHWKWKDAAVGIIGAVGSLTNTVLVLGSIFLFGLVLESVGVVSELMAGILSTVILFNALPEAALSCVVVMALVRALTPLYRRSGRDPYSLERKFWS